MTGQQTRDEITVNEIVAAARKLFAQHGLKKTTMEDIAQAMGKGKSTLYYYFPGKSEIFEAVVDEEMKNLTKILRQAINNATTSKGKLKAYLNTRLAAMQQHHNLCHIVYDDLLDHMTTILKLKQKHDHIQIDMIREILTGGVQSGEFTELSPKNIELFACITVAAFRGLELPPSVERFGHTCHGQLEVLVDMMVDGIGK